MGWREETPEFKFGYEIGYRKAKYKNVKIRPEIDILTTEEAAAAMELPADLVVDLRREKVAETRDAEAYEAGRGAGRREIRELVEDVAEWARVTGRMPRAEAVVKTLECTEEDATWAIDFLKSVKESAVQTGFLMSPYDYKEDMRVKREEARAAGRAFAYLTCCRDAGKSKEVAVDRLKRFLQMATREAVDYVEENWEEAGEEAGKE